MGVEDDVRRWDEEHTSLKTSEVTKLNDEATVKDVVKVNDVATDNDVATVSVGYLRTQNVHMPLFEPSFLRGG